MTDLDPHDLLVRATSGLDAPDHLIASGMARGRARRRTHLAGTAIAGLALAGVAAVAVPQLLPTSSDPGPSVGQPGPLSQPQSGERVPIAPEAGAAVLTSLMPPGEVSDATNDDRYAEGEQVGTDVASRLVYDGGVVEAEVFRFHSAADEAKAAELGQPLETAAEACGLLDHSECVLLEDGSYFDHGTSGFREEWMEQSVGYLVTEATLWTTDGYVVRLFAYNVGPKDTDTEYGDLKGEDREEFELVNGGEPVLTPAELQEIATSPQWFQAG